MRKTESEMSAAIIAFAKQNKYIRAVYMNGSRANPSVVKDIYQDYDIVFVVTETNPFLDEKSWISYFGQPAIIQEPDSLDFGWGSGHDPNSSYTWLILFKDGNRLDLKIIVTKEIQNVKKFDSLIVTLLDKDTLLPAFPPSNDSDYWIKQPKNSEYLGCCNEFWWCLNNVAKGIVRDQIPYAMRMYHGVVHIELDRMMEWYIAMQHEFQLSTGMWGKYFKEYLSPEMYKSYLNTYINGVLNGGNIWNSIFNACTMFRTIAKDVANKMGFIYNNDDDTNMMNYLYSMQTDSHDNGNKSTV